jgi:hypothetical protein
MNSPRSIIRQPPGEKNSIKIDASHFPPSIQGYYIFKALIDLTFAYFLEHYKTADITKINDGLINGVNQYINMFGYIFRLQIHRGNEEYSFYDEMIARKNHPNNYCVLYNDDLMGSLLPSDNKTDEKDYAYIQKINDVIYKIYFISTQ